MAISVRSLLRAYWPLAALVPLAVVLHFTPLGVTSPTTAALSNALHAPGFGVLSVLVLLLLRRRIPGLRAYAIAFLVAVAVSLVAEAAQIATARDASLDDFANDLTGILSFLLLALVFDGRWSRPGLSWPRLCLAAPGLLGFVISIYPLAKHIGGITLRTQARPVLLDFEQGWQTAFYGSMEQATSATVKTPDGWPAAGERILKIHIGESNYSGIWIAPAADWSGFSRLGLIAASVSDRPFSVTVRIHDRRHNNEFDDRFTQSYSIGPKPRRILIPLSAVESAAAGRSIDLDEIESIMIYIPDPTGSEQLLLDDIRLGND